MRYEMMYPDQLRRAIKESWPVVLPLGVLEYHAGHCVLGVDTLLVRRAVEILEQEMDMVVLPAFFYGAASYGVAAPEGNGSVQIGAPALRAFASDLFRSLLRIGFRNIHVFIHHQSNEFWVGMPTDLAFRLAAREVVFEFCDQTKGEGWWGSEEMSNYFAEQAQFTDPFNWIRVHPLMNEETQKRFPIDHADKQETSLMLAFCPEGVDMKRFSAEHWFCRNAPEANLEYGNAAKAMILDGMRKVLKRQG
jgi:creatinine amidohydrolase/Fe(II)-dependent formamide hydrolase-like protein